MTVPLLVLVLAARLAASPVCSFECLSASESNLAICAPVAQQFSMEVTDPGAGLVGFQFTHAGPAAVTMTNFYISDASDLVTGFANAPWTAPGAQFASGGPDISPALTLPVGFVQEFKAQAIAGSSLSPGETVTIHMALAPGSTTEAVRLALIDSQFRVIVATLGIGGSGRTQYLEASCCEQVPEPRAMGLVGLGLMGLGLRRLAATKHTRRRPAHEPTFSRGGRNGSPCRKPESSC
ncbi:MAG: PEP-CTERM sorting domain-containing protein [Bryobacteraceae bacterium]|nr:PEP-CTERM sorting domain-containing protein [Bryobacteraceae bacterium]